jgi:uncharacterized caspase-like protein
MLDTTWHYAVIVGIDKYPRIDSGNLDLGCPMEDARQMEAWFTSPQGGNMDAARVKVLTRAIPVGRNPPVPVFDEINTAILECVTAFVNDRKTRFPDKEAQKTAWQNSRFYFYISGHGMDGDGSDAVLITANATRTSMNHISTRNVLNRLKKDKVFGELVVLADCCRELAGVDVQDLPWDLRNYSGFNDPVLPRVFVAYASRNRKQAFEPPTGACVQNSIFTQVLLEGLQGGVSGNEVNSENLGKFLYTCVPELAKRLTGSDQNPEITADPGIVFLQTTKDYNVTLTAQPGSVFAALPDVDALVMVQAAVQSRTTLSSTAPGVFSGRLETGFYAIVPPAGDPMAGCPVHALSVLGKDTNESIG